MSRLAQAGHRDHSRHQRLCAELAPDYDGFILDLWGVVHDGIAPFPGVLDCMGRLIAAGKRIVLLSNAPRRADDVIRRIDKIGVPRGLYHGVMSSGEEAWLHLQDATSRSTPRSAGAACISAPSATSKCARGSTSTWSRRRRRPISS